MTRKPNRTRPLDRDGDGRDGGSLPGNGTAPLVEGAARPPIVIVTGRWSDDVTDDDMIQKTQAAAVTAWGEGNFVVGMKGTRAVAWPNGVPEPAEGDPALVAAIEADLRDADATPPAEAQQQPDADQPPATADAVTHLAETDLTEAEARVQLAQLQLLIVARRLYKSDQGYSATYAAPFVPADVAQDWIDKGLAIDVPTAGNVGGVRVHHKARALATRLFQQLSGR